MSEAAALNVLRPPPRPDRDEPLMEARYDRPIEWQRATVKRL